MKNTAQQDYSTLEKELTSALERTRSDDDISPIRYMMIQMSESPKTKEVRYVSYPACNSNA